MESENKADEGMTTITLKIPNDLLMRLKKKAATLGITYKELIVRIIHIEAEKIRKEMEEEININS